MSVEYRCSSNYLTEAKKHIKMVVFDLDGTLTKIDSIWRYIHEKFGVWERAKKHKEMFFSGKINYEEWAKLDAELWKGRKLEEFIKIVNEIPLMEDALEVINYLSKKYKVIILSSGLDIIKHRFENVKIHKFVSNKLRFQNNIFTGEVEVSVKFDNKHKVLHNILAEYGYSNKNVAAIGDAINDLNMLKEAKLAISVNPKNKEIELASHLIIRGKTLKPLTKIL